MTALVVLCSGVPVGYGRCWCRTYNIRFYIYIWRLGINTQVAMCCFAFSTVIDVDSMVKDA
ncbi:MAG: hypothetical protein ACLS9K_09725 [Lachnospira eligens]